MASLNEFFVSVLLSHVEHVFYSQNPGIHEGLSITPCFCELRVWTDTHDMVIISGTWARKGKDC